LCVVIIHYYRYLSFDYTCFHPNDDKDWVNDEVAGVDDFINNGINDDINEDDDEEDGFAITEV
jgi:hypothetical protein